LAQDDSLALLAHELKTPLVTVRQACALLADGVAEPLSDDQRKLVEVIRRGIGNLEEMTREILELARASHHDVVLHHSPVELLDVVRAICAGLGLQAQAEGIELVIDGPTGLPPLWGDGERLGHVVENLVTNALRHSPRGGQVVVQLIGEENRQMVRVRDHGPGIDPDDLPHLFLPFARGRDARDGQGHGLGLHLCQRVVVAHGGRIWVEQPENGGSDFVFVLPVDRRAAHGAEEPVAQEAVRWQRPGS
jgi:signal transduction histidine kinase